MKQIIALGLLIMLILPQAHASFGGSCSPLSGKPQPARDPGDTFPWGSERPFPWRGIQGTWQAEINGCAAYITFKTVRSSSGLNQLQVTQYEPSTCEVVSRGVGFENDRVVKAVMTAIPGITFNLTVHVFNRADLRSGNLTTFAARTVTVMNISPLGDSEDVQSFELQKISTDPKGICNQ